MDDSNLSLICSPNRRKVEEFIDNKLKDSNLEVKSVSVDEFRTHLKSKYDSQGFRRPILEML